MSSLAFELFREVQPGLFRVLAGTNGAAYIDVLNALEVECSQRQDGISREEAINIVMASLALHPEFFSLFVDVGLKRFVYCVQAFEPLWYLSPTTGLPSALKSLLQLIYMCDGSWCLFGPFSHAGHYGVALA